MDVHKRVFEVERGLLVELCVLLLGHFLAGGAPQGGLFIDWFLAFANINGEADVIGMLMDDALDPVLLSEFGCVLLELDLYLGSAVAHVCGANLIAVLSGRIPADSLSIRLIGAGSHPHPFRHHEDGIKAHPKLADYL